MKLLLLTMLAAVAATGGLAAVWMRERRAKTVFPASQAGALLNPARRLIQRPEQMVAAFGVTHGDRVLEIGPGPGYFTLQAACAVGDRGRVVCLDLQPAMLEQLRERLPDAAAPRVHPLAADAMRLPLRDASFDRAFLVSVLGEVPDASASVAELRRVLRPGGTVAFAEALTDPDYVRQRELRRLCWEAGLRFVELRRQVVGYIMRFERPETNGRREDAG